MKNMILQEWLIHHVEESWLFDWLVTPVNNPRITSYICLYDNTVVMNDTVVMSIGHS